MLPEQTAPALVTERLILRPFQMSDRAPYARMNADPDVMRYLGGPISGAETERQMIFANQSWAQSRVGKIAVTLRSDETFLGMCGLSFEKWYPDDLELGWRLAPAYWGKGYATEAAFAWLDYGYATLRARRIISIADVPNQRSIAVMKRLGMNFDHTRTLDADGDIFDAVIYARARPADTMKT